MVKLVTERPSYIVNSQFSIGRNNWDDADHLCVSQISTNKLFRTVALEPPSEIHPLPKARKGLKIESLEFDDPLIAGRKISGEQLLDRRLYNDALLVAYRGQVVHESYRNGMKSNDPHLLHSCTKSLCSMIVAIAIEEGLIFPESVITDYIPEYTDVEAWQGVTLQHVWDMQTGIEFSEDYSNPDDEYYSYARAAGYYPPLEGEQAIGVKKWVFDNLNRRKFIPGTCFSYGSAFTIVLGIVLENVYKRPLEELFETKLFKKIGAEGDGLFNTDQQGFPIVEGQLSLCLRDFARCAFLMVNQGKNLDNEQVIPANFFQNVISRDTCAQRAYHLQVKDEVFPEGQYKCQFWVFDSEQKQFAMIGIHGQFAWCDLNRDILIVGFSSYPKQDGKLPMTMLKILWQGIVQALDS